MKFSTQGQHMSDERYHLESNSSGKVVLSYDPSRPQDFTLINT